MGVSGNYLEISGQKRDNAFLVGILVSTKKKMPLSEKSTSIRLDYLPAQLSKGKTWYVYYYAYNPATDALSRKRIKINRIKSKTERLAYARKLIKELNQKLSDGWSPYIEAKASRAFVLLLDALSTYQNHTFKTLEPNSIRSYSSFCRTLENWIKKQNATMYCHSFDAAVAGRFMLDLRLSKSLTARTYNNYLTFYKNLFNWLCEFEYVPVNPFEKLKKEKVKHKQKNRVAFTREELKGLFAYLEKTNIRYCVICQLIYYCLLRPDDIVKLKRSQIDLNKHIIRINADDTKNDKDSVRIIPVHLDKYFEKLNLLATPANDYLFSENKTFKNGTKKLDARELARYWADRVRPAMAYDLRKKLYSLKDTGITNMMTDGVSPVFVQYQADHYSLEVTNKYIHNDLPEGFGQLRNNVKSVF